jgi:hypothetical protein
MTEATDITHCGYLKSRADCGGKSIHHLFRWTISSPTTKRAQNSAPVGGKAHSHCFSLDLPLPGMIAGRFQHGAVGRLGQSGVQLAFYLRWGDPRPKIRFLGKLTEPAVRRSVGEAPSP